MISLCCFSKNRPLQLNAFLESLKNARYITEITVLYTYDDDRFKEGYNELIAHYNGIEFIKEQNDRKWWKETILEIVEGFQEYFCWATDDSLFYRQARLSQDKLDWVFKEKKALSLNLRVGENIKWQNHWYAEKTPQIEVLDRFEDLMVWDAEPLGTQNDFGRVLQNDCSIMSRNLYLERLMIEDHWYKGKGCRGLDNIAQSGGIFSPRFATSFNESVYVNIPVNLVHLLDDGRLYADNYSRFINQDIFYLQEKFDEGLRIDWEKIDFTGLDCARKEVVYEFK
jgi:hypothetical protein